MSWLFPYYTGRTCDDMIVTQEIPDREITELEGVYKPKITKIISFIWDRKLVGHDCLA